MSDKLRINIRLGNYPPISLNGISPAEEEVARQAERQINRLWQSWCSRWKEKSADEVMAMVAFRFAQLYFGKQADLEAASKRLERLGASLAEAEKAMEKAVAEAMADAGDGIDDGTPPPHGAAPGGA